MTLGHTNTPTMSQAKYLLLKLEIWYAYFFHNVRNNLNTNAIEIQPEDPQSTRVSFAHSLTLIR